MAKSKKNNKKKTKKNSNYKNEVIEKKVPKKSEKNLAQSERRAKEKEKLKKKEAKQAEKKAKLDAKTAKKEEIANKKKLEKEEKLAEKQDKAVKKAEAKETAKAQKTEEVKEKAETAENATPVAEEISEETIEEAVEESMEEITEEISEETIEEAIEATMEEISEVISQEAIEKIAEDAAKEAIEEIAEEITPDEPDVEQIKEEITVDAEIKEEKKEKKEKSSKSIDFTKLKGILKEKLTLIKNIKLTKKDIIIIAVAVVTFAALIALIVKFVPAMFASDSVPEIYTGRDYESSELGVGIISITDEQQMEYVKQTNAKGNTRAFKFYANTEMQILTSTSSLPISVANPTSSRVVLLFTLVDENGAMLYRSRGITPGQYLNNITLYKPLEYGDNELTLYVSAFSAEEGKDGGTEYKKEGTQRAKIKIKVGEEYMEG